MKRTVIIGLGNPVLTDDALGPQTADILRSKLADLEHVEIIKAYCGGLSLQRV